MSIEAAELVKRFGDHVAVAGLDLSIPAGEIFGLIGPNGAGKTTTLRMLAGLLAPTSGRATVGGVDVVAQPTAAKARLGFLTATTGLYERLSPREVLQYFGGLYGVAPAIVEARIADVARRLSIVDLLDGRCGKLSTGQRQRVSLARATIHDPAVVILDEPTAGLDVLASRFVADFIRDCAERGRSVLVSTHYLSEAELLCDRVGLMHAGRLARQGPPAEVKAGFGASTLEEAFLRLVDEAGDAA